MSVGNDIWRQHIDQLRPGNMASTDTNAGESDSIDECPFRESSLQSSAETVPNTPEPSISTDRECRYPERECRPTQRLIENT